MSNVQSIMHGVQRAVEAYKDTDSSNTFVCIQGLQSDVQGYAMMTRTGYVEFDPVRVRAKLPACFTRDIGPFIQNYVILQDPNGNQIQVSIERKKTKMYFTRGWSRLRDFYGIGLGGWVTVLYISPFLFHIKVRRASGHEVNYPNKTPHYRLMLIQQPGNSSWDGPAPFFMPPKTFCHVLEKTLTPADIETGILCLSWRGFFEHAIADGITHLIFMDWYGHTWRCNLELTGHPTKKCNIFGQWGELCKIHRFIEGITLRFGVTKPSNNALIHFKISPSIGVRTTLIAPTTAGGYKAFYQSEHYYVL